MPSPSIPSRCESAALLVAMAVALTAGPVAAQGGSQEEREATKKARAHFKKGDEAFAAGRFEEAYKEFEAGYTLVPKSAFVLNMAHSERKRGQVRSALALYRKFLVVDPQSKLRTEVESVVQELELSLAAEDAARSTLQPPAPGGAPPLVAPREPSPAARRPDPAPATPSVALVTAPPAGPPDEPPGLSARADESPPGARPLHKRWYVWAGAGAVVAAGVVAAVVLSSGGSTTSYVKDGSLGTLK